MANMQIISDIVTTGLMAIVTGGGGWYLSTINKGLKVVKIDISELRDTVEYDNKQIKKILEKSEINIELDDITRDALYYVTDTKIMALVHLQGDSAKTFFSYVVSVGFDNVSCQEIRANFEALSQKLRDQLDQVDHEDFKKIMLERLGPIIKSFITKVIEIKNDQQYNSKVKRFRTATIATVQDVLSVIIRESIKVGI